MNSMRRALALLACAPLALLVLAGCAPTVALEPAADATNPGCAEIMVRLPQTVAGQQIRQTDAQATSAWGSPTAVILTCGVTPPGPTLAHCQNVAGIDWLLDSSKAPVYVFTTFGRTPATRVVVNSNLTDGQGTIIVDELSNAIGSIPQKQKCTSTDDVLGSSGITTPTPTPSPSK